MVLNLYVCITLKIIMFKSIFFSFLFINFFFLASAQDEIVVRNQANDLNILYRNQMAGGIIIHTGGFGLNFRRGIHVTGFKTRILEMELVNMKNPKEVKIKNPSYENSKGFYFGKLNTLLILRPGIGYQNVLFRKAERKSIEIRYSYFGGFSLGLAKPVYLEILKSSDPRFEELSVEKYDPAKHKLEDIYGRAPYFKGFDEMKIYPGAYAKFGLSFEYADVKSDIKAIETGVMLDFYPKAIPIMAYTKNQPLYVSLYLNFLYGKKWF